LGEKTELGLGEKAELGLGEKTELGVGEKAELRVAERAELGWAQRAQSDWPGVQRPGERGLGPGPAGRAAPPRPGNSAVRTAWGTGAGPSGAPGPAGRPGAR
jgi:hypothetical protein